MAYLAQTLVTRSWYLSGIVARNLQTITGDQINDGLQMLNDLLNFKQIETDLIPYYTYIQFLLVPAQEYYFLPNVASIESTTFNLNVVRYPMMPTSRRKYFASSRVDNINTLPFDWNFNRGENGGTLSLYFVPDSNYPEKMMCKLFLNNVTLQQDLTTVFAPLSSGFVSNIKVLTGGTGYTIPPTVTIAPSPTGDNATAFASISNGSVTSINMIYAGSGYSQVPTVTISGGSGTGATAKALTSSYTFLQTGNAGLDSSYIEYLRYALAQYMCSEYGIEFNPESKAILQKYERKLMYIAPPDLSRDGLSILTEGQGFNWGDVNIGHGFRPS
jgi:hypothetical protein